MHAVNLDYSSYSNQGPHVHRMTRDIQWINTTKSYWVIQYIALSMHPLNNWGQVDNQTVWCYSGLKRMHLKKLQLKTQPFDNPRQG